MDIAVLAQLLSSVGTLVVATGILYQGRQARKARDDTDRPQIIVDADYTGRFTTNIAVRNIGYEMAKSVTFDFSAPPSPEEEENYMRTAEDVLHYPGDVGYPARSEDLIAAAQDKGAPPIFSELLGVSAPSSGFVTHTR